MKRRELEKQIEAIARRGDFKSDLAEVLTLLSRWSMEVAPGGDPRTMAFLGALLGVSTLEIPECMEVMTRLLDKPVCMPERLFGPSSN